MKPPRKPTKSSAERNIPYGKKIAARMSGRTLEWRQVEDDWDGPGPEGYTWRAKVPGGWLVSVWAGDRDARWGGGLTFLSDPKHEWEQQVVDKIE